MTSRLNSIFKIDNDRRVIWSGSARRACGDPHPEVWADMRAMIGVPSGKRTLTTREAVLLFVAVQVLRNKHNKTKARIYAAANGLLNREPDRAWQIPKLCGAEGVLGKDLAESIGLETGYYPSEESLRAWSKSPRLVKFSRGTLYTAAQVTRYCNHARSLRSRRKQQNSAA